jgi:beta-lactamase class D
LIPIRTINEDIDIEDLFKQSEAEGCIVLFDPQNNNWIRYNPERCREGFMPKSTFKIPHPLIALEEGVLEDESQILPWDRKHILLKPGTMIIH